MHTPSRISRSLRAKLVGTGHTYRSMAALVGVSEHTVKAAVHGARHGAKAQKVLRAIKSLTP